MDTPNGINFKGKIYDWNGYYGFIYCDDGRQIFFHKDDLKFLNPNNSYLLSEVTFDLSESRKKGHEGTLKAKNIKIINRLEIEEHELHLGRLNSWDQSPTSKLERGDIASPLQEKTIGLRKGRSLYPKDELKVGDLLIFSQVKTSADKRLAVFAYKLEWEKNISVLKNLYLESSEPELLVQIKALAGAGETLSTKQEFFLELGLVTEVSDLADFKNLVKLIKPFVSKDFIPEWSDLTNICQSQYLIELWENGLVNNPDLSVILIYFVNNNLRIKESIIKRLPYDQQEKIVTNYIQFLKEKRLLSFINPKLREILRFLSKKDKLTANRLNLVTELTNSLKESDVYRLWIEGFLLSIDTDVLKRHINLNDEEEIKKILVKGDYFSAVILSSLEENLFALISGYFEIKYMRIAIQLMVIAENFKAEYQAIKSKVSLVTTQKQKFILKLFNAPIEFDLIPYYLQKWSEVNLYQTIRLINMAGDQSKFPDSALERVTLEKIEDFIDNVSWNDSFQPTEIMQEKNIQFAFMHDVSLYIETFSPTGFTINDIGKYTFTSIPEYTVMHLRLWLYGYLDHTCFDYTGFKQYYSELTRLERKIFKAKASGLMIAKYVTIPELNSVRPCTIFDTKANGSQIYHAFLFNFYFKEGKLKLLTENNFPNGPYTKEFPCKDASSGLNRIPESHSICRIPITCEVSFEGNILAFPVGLDDILMMIRTEEIGKSLEMEKESNQDNQDQGSYVEDWKLRKSIIDLLNQKQIFGLDPISVYENNTIRGEYSNSNNVTDLEHTQLFSVETADGISIVWEDIDLSDDKATYIFKATKERQSVLLEKLVSAIASNATIRSTLSHNLNSEILAIYRKDLGYVGSIRKQRGDPNAFFNWEQKLEEAMKLPIPIELTGSEVDKLKQWTLGSTFTLKKMQRSIRQDKIMVSQIEYPDEKEKKQQNNPENFRLILLTELRAFTSSFKRIGIPNGIN